MQALGERFAEQLLAGIKAAVSEKSAHHWKEKLAAWSAACLTGYLDSIRLHDIVFNRARSRPHTREGLIDNIIIDHLEDLLQSGTRDRTWKIEDPRFTAVYLFSALHGIVDYTVAREKRPNVPLLKKKNRAPLLPRRRPRPHLENPPCPKVFLRVLGVKSLPQPTPTPF